MKKLTKRRALKLAFPLVVVLGIIAMPVVAYLLSPANADFDQLGL